MTKHAVQTALQLRRKKKRVGWCRSCCSLGVRVWVCWRRLQHPAVSLSISYLDSDAFSTHVLLTCTRATRPRRPAAAMRHSVTSHPSGRIIFADTSTQFWSDAVKALGQCCVSVLYHHHPATQHRRNWISLLKWMHAASYPLLLLLEGFHSRHPGQRRTSASYPVISECRGKAALAFLKEMIPHPVL